MSDERKLIAEAREWSRIVEASEATDWRKGYVEDGLHHVARLSDALEAVLASTRFPGEREEDDVSKTLGEALPQEMSRVRDLLPYYDRIPTGAFAATMIRHSLDDARDALAKGDVGAMARCYEDLRGYEA